MKRLLALAAMAAILVATPLSGAFHQGKHNLGRLKQELTLSDTQVERLKAIMKDAKATRPERTGDKPTDHAAMQKHREAVDARINALLTAEQQAKFKAMKERAHSQHGKKRSR